MNYPLLLPKSERRRRPRAPISIAVKQRIGDRVHLCQTGDINGQGMFIARVYEGLLPAHQKCWLEFTLPGCPTRLEVRAQLRWQTKHQHYHLMAMTFRSIAPSHRRLIEDYATGEPFAADGAPFVRR